MTNFQIHFNYAWLLLLIIPVIVITLIPYLRLSKKYRRTRTRVISIILNVVICVFAIGVLAGINFTYDVPNTRNELMLLVDVSFSGKKTEESKNDFVKSVIDASADSFKIGVVTFGYGQQYVAELTSNTSGMYDKFLNSIAADNTERPDESATDIASALRFARDLLESPQTAKIVLISDGLETDGNALSVIKAIAAEGIRVDTVLFGGEEKKNEVQLIAVETPDYSLKTGDQFDLTLTVQSSFAGQAEITLSDESDESSKHTEQITLAAGIQTFIVKHSFAEAGLHTLRFSISSQDDNLKENNTFYSYINLEVFDKLLIIERTEDESKPLQAVLGENYKVSVLNLSNSKEVPSTLDGLREYDEIVLVNVANSDMPEGFDGLLYSYVNDIGGGLFTVGGDRQDELTGETVANMYNRSDMYGTLYQELLPVQAINYTPPVGVMIIVDRSGSMLTMDTSTGKTKLDLAKEGAKSCLGALTERDWCGVMSLEDSYSEDAELTPVPQMSKIMAAIENIPTDGGGTMFTGALDRAGKALKALSGVEKRHIILVTDGEPYDTIKDFGPIISSYYEDAGITLSIVSIGVTSNASAQMRQAAEELGHGRFYDIWNAADLPQTMREDLKVPEIKDVNYEPFTPTIRDHTSVVSGINQADIPMLGGFYGTKIRKGADVPLMGTYVPVYAQWKYGEGMVGSYMCNLGDWSAEFLASDAGQKFFNNVVSGLFPTKNIRPCDIEVKLGEENYNNQLNVYTPAKEGEKLEVTVTSPSEEEGGEPSVQTINAELLEGYSRVTFTVTRPGLHEICVKKIGADGNVISQYTFYKTFSYSAEYNAFVEEKSGADLMAQLSEDGRGNIVTDAEEVFAGFVRTLHKSYDPRLPLIIAALILFLIEVALRKFKFKWLHEIVRDYKAKKALKGGKE